MAWLAEAEKGRHGLGSRGRGGTAWLEGAWSAENEAAGWGRGCMAGGRMAGGGGALVAGREGGERGVGGGRVDGARRGCSRVRPSRRDRRCLAPCMALRRRGVGKRRRRLAAGAGGAQGGVGGGVGGGGRLPPPFRRASRLHPRASLGRAEGRRGTVGAVVAICGAAAAICGAAVAICDAAVAICGAAVAICGVSAVAHAAPAAAAPVNAPTGVDREQH